MTAAQREEEEKLAHYEALKKIEKQEKLVAEMDFEDPELAEEVDPSATSPKSQSQPSDNLPSKTMPDSVTKYVDIFNQIEQVELPKLRKIIEHNLPKFSEAKTLVEFIDVKHSMLLDFQLTITFYINLVVSEKASNIQFHPIVNRLEKYENIYTSYSQEGSDFHTLNELQIV